MNSFNTFNELFAQNPLAVIVLFSLAACVLCLLAYLGLKQRLESQAALRDAELDKKQNAIEAAHRKKQNAIEKSREQLKHKAEEQAAVQARIERLLKPAQEKMLEQTLATTSLSDDELGRPEEYLQARRDFIKSFKQIIREDLKDAYEMKEEHKVVWISMLNVFETARLKITPNNAVKTAMVMNDNLNSIAENSWFNGPFSYATTVLNKALDAEVAYKRAKQLARDTQKELRAMEREEAQARKEALAAEAKAAAEEIIVERTIAEVEEKLRAATAEEREGLTAEIEKLQVELEAAHARMERARSRAQDTKQGHVYIISNIGSFGEDVYKIGLTRRMDPMERVKELGDASVPFTFDVHALIESDDAPALEAALHKHFHHKRVNKVNTRKEFFNVSIEEIERELKVLDIDAELNLVPDASQYYASIKTDLQAAA